MPNPNTIPYYRHQDIQMPDVALRTQFNQYIGQGAYQQAVNLLVNNQTQLEGKKYTAEIIQAIADGIVALETLYNDATTVYLNSLMAQYTGLINNFISRGAWTNSVQYTPYNFVVYNNDVYMAIQQPPIGTVPTNEQYWLHVGLRGPKGAPGIDVTMRYDWSNSVVYQPNDLVVWNNDIYVALQQNVGVEPSDETNWLLFLKIIRDGIWVGPNPPVTYGGNSVWFQTEQDPRQVSGTDPMIGQLKRYIVSEGIWDEMYPDTLFTLVNGRENYHPVPYEESVTISAGDWASGSWTYTNNLILDTSFVSVLPEAGYTTQQTELYNSLSLSVNLGGFTLTTDLTPVDISIRVYIY